MRKSIEALDNHKPSKFFTSFRLHQSLKREEDSKLSKSSSVPEILLINQNKPHKGQFLPFIAERDNLGKLINSSSEHFDDLKSFKTVDVSQ